MYVPIHRVFCRQFNFEQLYYHDHPDVAKKEVFYELSRCNNIVQKYDDDLKTNTNSIKVNPLFRLHPLNLTRSENMFCSYS